MTSGNESVPAGLDPSLAALAAASSLPTMQQQDANECWTEIVRILQKAVVDSSKMQSIQVSVNLFLIHPVA